MKPLLRTLALAGVLALLLLMAIRYGLLGFGGLSELGRDAGPSKTGPASPMAWFPPAEHLDTASQPGRSAPETDSSAAQKVYASRLREDWCGFGARELSRDMQEVPGQAPSEAASPERQAREQAREQVMKAAEAQVSRAWQQALRRRGEPRALALAEYIGAGQSEDLVENRASRARLQALALTSSDPLVTALALRRPCEAGQCRNVEVSQWSRLEPENLAAWLLMFNDPQLRRSQGDYLMERMASQGRYSRSYEREVGELLVQVLQSEGPGLMHEAESGTLAGLLSAWSISSYSGLLQTCRDRHSPTAAKRGDTRACEAIANALWAEGDLLERRLALGLAGAVLPPTHAQRVRWEERAREAEAVHVLEEERLNRSVQDLMSLAESPANLCERYIPSLRSDVLTFAAGKSWDLGQAQLQQGGLDRASLSQRWREKNGRSMLDPVRRQAAP